MSLIVNTVIFAHLFYWEVLTKLKNIMKYILPLLFIAYLGGITLFTHSHVVNGVIIVHSHPFKGQHGHTEVQLETIFYLASFVSSSFPPLPVAATVFLVLLCVLSIPATECIKCVKLRGGICLRAPPSFFQIR
ncbi:hypothetical protein [Bacteroides uniformis]